MQAVAHDDFGIDLEKELMGEFADHEPAPAAAPPVQTAAAIQPDDDVEMVIDDDFEDAFAASLERTRRRCRGRGCRTGADALPQASRSSRMPSATTMRRSMERFHNRNRASILPPEIDVAPEFELDDLDLSEPHVEAPTEPEMHAEPVVPAHLEASDAPAAE